MGLSASQARLLNLTARMHDIEYKAQNLEAQKLQMANDSNKVYAEYEEALNATKIQQKTIAADGSISFVDIAFSDINGYRLKVCNVETGVWTDNVDPTDLDEIRTASGCGELQNTNETLSNMIASKNLPQIVMVIQLLMKLGTLFGKKLTLRQTQTSKKFLMKLI